MRVNPQHEPLAQYVQAFRHDMHQYPELSHQEFETTRKIRAELEKEGIRILDLPLKTGLVAEIGSPEAESMVVVRADIDALPIEEESGVAFSSHHQGVMHACGHDFHTSAALGAAILLKRAESEIKGRVRILFQAAEETGLGAPDVIATGALDGATAIFGIHNDPTLPVGVIGGKDGALTAGVDRFEIKIAAKGCHAAKPHEGNDPIVIVGQLIGAVQTIISRNVPSDNNAVVSITQVHSGSTWNVIPDTAYLEGTVRTFSSEARNMIEQRFRQIVAGIASTYGAEIELLWHAGPPSVVNTPRWVEFSLQVASDEGFEARRVEASPIGEDFSFYQHKLPGTFMMVGSGGPYALHHPKFRVDDRALFPTAHYLYSVARKSLEQLSQEA
ncbi:amidohydrolase [Lonsdalea quercina]|uniref:amidohydrolase n=1 Tax=Lonsdalea quercina TaxID=71657 RepID=UPI003976DFA6